ncbi:MAG: hypothetical protein AABZ55_06580 [Bdellovibrionota bacterium]
MRGKSKTTRRFWILLILLLGSTWLSFMKRAHFFAFGQPSSQLEDLKGLIPHSSILRASASALFTLPTTITIKPEPFLSRSELEPGLSDHIRNENLSTELSLFKLGIHSKRQLPLLWATKTLIARLDSPDLEEAARLGLWLDRVADREAPILQILYDVGLNCLDTDLQKCSLPSQYGQWQDVADIMKDYFLLGIPSGAGAVLDCAHDNIFGHTSERDYLDCISHFRDDVALAKHNPSGIDVLRNKYKFD